MLKCRFECSKTCLIPGFFVVVLDISVFASKATAKKLERTGDKAEQKIFLTCTALFLEVSVCVYVYVHVRTVYSHA